MNDRKLKAVPHSNKRATARWQFDHHRLDVGPLQQNGRNVVGEAGPVGCGLAGLADLGLREDGEEHGPADPPLLDQRAQISW